MWGAIKKAINSNLNKSLDVLIQEKHSETNSKIDSKSSQVSVDTVKSLVQDGNNLIGVTNNSGGTSTSGSIFAKLNKLLTDWTTTRAGYIDTTVSSRASQSGLNTLQGTANTINANVGALVNGRVVKSVQRGSNYAYNPPSTQKIVINHSPIDLNKSYVILRGQCYYTNTGTCEALVTSRNTNSFEIGSTLWDYRSGRTIDMTVVIAWELVEFY